MKLNYDGGFLRADQGSAKMCCQMGWIGCAIFQVAQKAILRIQFLSYFACNEPILFFIPPRLGQGVDNQNKLISSYWLLHTWFDYNFLNSSICYWKDLLIDALLGMDVVLQHLRPDKRWILIRNHTGGIWDTKDTSQLECGKFWK